ncbi:MAG: nicotinate-nucleotide--dimethylbenzimidazole phosphoribosyltransferase, partial [Clostridiales bacterium]
MSLLKETISKIKPLNEEAMKEANERIDSLIKPIGALGKLEEIAAQVAGITGKQKNEMKKRGIIVMAADNGICDEGVASAPQSVTTIMTGCFIKGVTGMAVLAKEANADVTVVDIGVKDDLNIKGILNKKIAHGTANFAKGPAMSYEDCVKAMEIGIEVANDLAAKDYDIIGTGEMGIGNTSSSSCVLVSLTDVTMDTSVGKGAGLTGEAHQHKKDVLNSAIALNKPNPKDPIDVVAKVGGFDIAGLAGVFLACAANRIPVVVDGFISAAAALVAVRLCPTAKEFMITSHCSAEPGFMAMMDAAGLEPMLQLGMRLGEGSGCPIAFHVVDSAMTMMNNMATFAEVTMDDDFLV